jgi:hypothetical protein
MKEFAHKREQAVSTNEQLQQEAQAVLDVIENPDVAQALRQDKIQNLQYLKDNYNVIPISLFLSVSLTVCFSSLLSKLRSCTISGNSSTLTGTTAAPLIIFTISESCLLTTISTPLPTGANSPPIF